jgi:hypothetical protein
MSSDDGNSKTLFIHLSFFSFDNEKKKETEYSIIISFRNANVGGVERFVSFIYCFSLSKCRRQKKSDIP